MKNLKTFLIVAFACLAFVPGARGQYHWIIAHPITDSGYTYAFTSVDCSGEVCTAAGYKETSSLRITNICLRSIDGGLTWVEQDPGLPHNERDNAAYLSGVQQIDSLTAFVIGSDSGLVLRTTDGGNTWVRKDSPAPSVVNRFHFSDPLTGIAVVTYFNNIITTSDGGTTWISSPWYPWLGATMCHSDGGQKFRVIAIGDGPLYYTSDDWNTVDSTSVVFQLTGSADSGNFSNCAFRGTDTLVGGGERFTHPNDVQTWAGPLLMTSTDNGVNWHFLDVPSDGGFTSIDCISSLDRDIVFAGGLGNSRHIMESTDHGMSWRVDTLSYPLDTERAQTISLAVTADNHCVAVLGGGYYTSTVLMLGEPANLGVMVSYAIDSAIQIYPNPALNTVSIVNSIKQISILDPLGRSYEVERNGNTLDVSALPPGVYFISDGISRAKFVKE